MTFRVTSNTFSSQAIRFSALHSKRIAIFQEQISSGLKLQRASEDPATFRRITATRAQLLEFQADPESPAYNTELKPDRRVILYCGTGGREYGRCGTGSRIFRDIAGVDRKNWQYPHIR